MSSLSGRIKRISLSCWNNPHLPSLSGFLQVHVCSSLALHAGEAHVIHMVTARSPRDLNRIPQNIQELVGDLFSMDSAHCFSV